MTHEIFKCRLKWTLSDHIAFLCTHEVLNCIPMTHEVSKCFFCDLPIQNLFNACLYVTSFPKCFIERHEFLKLVNLLSPVFLVS